MNEEANKDKTRATAKEQLDADLVAAVKAARAGGTLTNNDIRLHLTELLDTIGGVLR